MALSEIEKLEARFNENPDGRFFAPLADAYRKAGRVDDALQVVQVGLQKHPDYLSAHIVLGRCYLDKSDDANAQRAFASVLGLDSENIIALKSLAEIAERTGDTEAARRWLARLLGVDPMNAEADEDLKRLGGPPGAGEAEPVAEAAVSFADLEMAIAETAPMDAIDIPMAEPAAAAASESEPEMVVEASGHGAMQLDAPPVVAADLTLDMTVPSTREMEAAAPAAGFQSTSFEPPADLEAAPAPGFESTGFEPPTEAVATADVGLETVGFEPPAEVETTQLEGVTDFDDSLGWGAGERVSHAIRQEDIEAAASQHAETASAIEFLGEAGPAAAPEKDAAPAASEPAPAAEWTAAPESATLEMAPVRMDAVGTPPEEGEALPLIMPEDVTPPEEMRRPSVKLVQFSEEESASTSGNDPMITETVAELYLRQGLKDQALDVYRRLVAQRPGDSVLRARLAALEAPAPLLSAAALGAESLGMFLRRIARSSLAAPAPAPAPPSLGEPSPLEQAFAGGESEPAPAADAALAPPVEAVPGEPARPANDAFSLDQIFGSAQGGAAPSTPAPQPEPGSIGASFDEFFGAAPAQGESVRPRSSRAPRGSEDDLSAFNAWLHGLKR
jgi:tetratricopeptide (TPR) repeat protein